MTRRFTKILAALALLVGLTIPMGMWGQETTTVYLETFGSTSSNTAYSSYSGFSATQSMFTDNNAVNTHYSGNGSVGKNNLSESNLSNGYDGASGLSGCYHTGTANTQATIIQISGINIAGYENLQVSFGALGGSTSHKINVQYKIDDGEFVNLISNGAITNANWTLLSQGIGATGNSLTLKFTHTPTKAWTIRMDDIKVTGIVSSADPTITLSKTSLTGFNYVQGAGPSASQSFKVSGTNLGTNNITVSLDANSNYEMSEQDGDNWSSITSKTLTPTSGTVSETTLYVRMKSGLTGNEITGTITAASDGATSKSISLSGSVTPTYTLAYSATNGNISGVLAGTQTTVTSGAALVEGTEVTLTAEPSNGYRFVSWSDGGSNATLSSTTDNPTTFTMGTANVTITASFEARTPAIVTLHDGLNGATTTSVSTYTDATLADVIEGHTIATVNGWTALGWVKNYTSGTPTLITNSEAVGSTTDLYAVYRHGNDVIYQLTTSTSDLSVGTRYMIGYYNSGYLLMTTNFAGTSAVSLDANNQYTYTTGTQWTLGGSNNAWTFTDANGKLLSSQSTSGSSASLKLESTATDYSYWSISYDQETVKHSLIQNNGNVSNNSKELKISYYNSVFNCYNNAVVYLFKEVTEYSTAPTADLCYVTYEANGATTGNVPTDGNGYNPGASVIILGNTGTLVRTGYTWSGWCLNAEGTGTVYGPTPYTTSYTINTNTTFYAKWAVQSYSYTLTDDSHSAAELRVGGSTYSAPTIPYNTEVEVYVETDDDYVYTISVKDASGNDVELTNNKFNMPASDVTITVTSRLLMKYVLVTSEEQLVAGQHYVIASGKSGNSVEGVGYQKTSNRDAVDVEFDSDGKIIENNYLWDFVLGGDATNGWTFYDKYTEGEGFLCAPASGTSNTLKLQEAVSTNASWGITISSTTATNPSVASIVAKSGTRTYMRYNSQNSLFACYEKNTNQSDIYLFVKDDDKDYEIYSASPITGTHNITTLFVKGKLTIKDNAVITVSGEVVNSTAKADSLVIEDGGQLITNSTGVQATVKKTIAAHGATTADGGWNFIASPINSNSLDPATTGLGMITDNLGNGASETTATYDLYKFVENPTDNGKEWKNYRNATFNLANGQGYLYASKEGTTLNFTGSINPCNQNVEVNLDFTTGAEFAGWNLVGNPFTFNAYVNRSYYKMNDDGSAILADVQASGSTIAPCTGIMVKATAETGQSVTFSKEPIVNAPSNGNVSIAVVQANERGTSTTTVDNAIVSFNENDELAKFYFMEQNANLYIPQGEKEYAIATSEGQGEMPLNFRANADGQYTLTVNPEGIEMNYLHLIDNMTGNDIDLLQTPSYSFNAKTTDYESRFRLVFASNGTSTSSATEETFAFFSNGNLVVNNEGEATLQVIDVMGRVLSNQTISGTAELNLNQVPGVYVLRLVNGNDVKTQKIVVK